MSYESLNFKGDINDFPLTVAYGKQVDALTQSYKDYLWNAEFRDTLQAKVTVAGAGYADYSVFLREDGKRAVVVTNTKTKDPIKATVTLEQPNGRALICASPEKPDGVSCDATGSIPPHSVIVIMER